MGTGFSHEIGSLLVEQAFLPFPFLYAPDFYAFAGPYDRDIFFDADRGSECGRNDDAALLVESAIFGRGEQFATGISASDGEVVGADHPARPSVPFVRWVKVETLFNALSQDSTVGGQLAESTGHGEPALGIERV